MNVISHDTIYENRKNKRAFVLTGLGLTYNINNDIESYANISQNYRSVTFADISTVNPAYAIDTDIIDEDGTVSDIGAYYTNINTCINQGDINNLNIKKKTVTEIISNEDIDEENI